MSKQVSKKTLYIVSGIGAAVIMLAIKLVATAINSVVAFLLGG